MDLNKLFDQPNELVAHLHDTNMRQEQKIRSLEEQLQQARQKNGEDTKSLQWLQRKATDNSTEAKNSNESSGWTTETTCTSEDETDYLATYTPSTTDSSRNPTSDSSPALQTGVVAAKINGEAFDTKQQERITQRQPALCEKCVSVPFSLDDAVTPHRREHMLMTMSEFKQKFTVQYRTTDTSDITSVDEKVWANEYRTIPEFSQEFIDNVLQDFLDGRTTNLHCQEMVNWFCAEMARMPPVMMLEAWR